jgi:hypothetical protein
MNLYRVEVETDVKSQTSHDWRQDLLGLPQIQSKGVWSHLFVPEEHQLEVNIPEYGQFVLATKVFLAAKSIR